MTSVLQHAVGDGASDIHIEPQAREVTVRFRVDGVLREVMSIPPKLQHAVTARFKLLGELNIAEKRVPEDGRFSVRLNNQKIHFRVASLPTAYGEKVVLRLLDTSAVDPDLNKLGFVQRDYERYEAISAGLTGPSWSRGRRARASQRRSTRPLESSTPCRRTSLPSRTPWSSRCPV